MNELTLMEKFVDPAMIDTLTMGEKSTGALITTLMGMGITFVVLIFLWGLIALMAKFTAEKTTVVNPDKDDLKKAGCPPTVNLPQHLEASTVSPEVIAVIMAAISAFEGGSSSNNLIIRKINRVTGQTTAWGTAGSSDAINSRKF